MNDCLGQQKARLPEMTVRVRGLPSQQPTFEVTGNVSSASAKTASSTFPGARDECASIFIRIDRHALSAFFAQPKVFATAEFTLSKS